MTRRVLLILTVLAPLAWLGWTLAAPNAKAQSDPTAADSSPPDQPPADAERGFEIHSEPSGANSVTLEHVDGQYGYRIVWRHGGTSFLTPDEFAERLYHDFEKRPWWQILLNVTGPWGIAWVVMGASAQLIFTGRMVVQWLASERKHASVVPVAFWWLSLLGASMLVLYFIWRKDIVGFGGQAAGWLIYVRNLWMIYHPANYGRELETTGGPPAPSDASD